MKKTLLVLGGGLLVLALAVYIGLQFFVGSAVKTAVNRFGPQLTQTKVELASANISPFSGTGTLGGLYVGNPPGWSSEKAFYLGEVHLDLEPTSLLGDHIVVNEILIDRPEFVYETKLVTSNIGEILRNIEQAMGPAKAGEPEAAGEPARFEVKHFRLQNGLVTVGVGPSAITLPMPPVELRDLGTKEGGITADQLAAAVMRNVTASVVGAATQAAGQVGSAVGGAATDAVKQTAEGFKKLFEKKK